MQTEQERKAFGIMKKKTVLWILSMAVCGSLLTGCGTAEKKESETIAATETAETSAREAGETENTETSAGEAGETENTETVTEEADETENTEETGEVDKTSVSGSQIGAQVSVSGWNITVEDVQKNTSLENVSVELGYTGVEKSNYQKEAESGKTFCLVKMLIEKDGSKETIDWSNLKLTDGKGNEYTRIEDDFLADLGMMRMTGNTLNFGKNEGWIAFEINENADGLELSYPFEEEAYHCAL